MRQCQVCSVELRGSGMPKYCLRCSQIPRPKIGKRRQPRPTKMILDGCVVCIHCQTPTKMKHYTPLSCYKCSQKLYSDRNVRGGQARAHLLVCKARKDGLLPDPSTLKCTDCDRAAEQYDHRDYGKPLEVDPVCRSCNILRGPALWADRVAQSEWLPRFPQLAEILTREAVRPDVFGPAEKAAA